MPTPRRWPESRCAKGVTESVATSRPPDTRSGDGGSRQSLGLGPQFFFTAFVVGRRGRLRDVPTVDVGTRLCRAGPDRNRSELGAGLLRGVHSREPRPDLPEEGVAHPVVAGQVGAWCECRIEAVRLQPGPPGERVREVDDTELAGGVRGKSVTD